MNYSNRDKILKGEICPYCETTPWIVDSTLVYGYDYNQSVAVCWDCDAWVGCHKGTVRPMGRLANKSLRKAKQRAHSYFDPLWKHKVKNGMPKNKARSKAYKWLSEQMGTDPDETHIGMFDLDQCHQVSSICLPYYKKIFNL